MQGRKSPTTTGLPMIGGLKGRLLIGVAMAVFALFSYFASGQYNEVTGERQYLSMTQEQEIALGQQSAPEFIREFGGLYPDESVQAEFDRIGNRLVNNSIARDQGWDFEFHVLNDPQTVNAFALPGGQVFITTALLSRLETEEEVAGVLSHEIVHVLARHGAQRIAKSELTNGLIGAVGVASGDASAAQVAAMAGQFVNMKFGRDDEHESDTIGVCIMISAGYDPQGMVQVMQVLAEASGGAGPPEFASTHPSSENRIAKIEEAIANAPRDCK